jgi:hypothetical protein
MEHIKTRIDAHVVSYWEAANDFKRKKTMPIRSPPMSLKISWLTVAVLLLYAGWRTFVSAPVHVAETHHVTTLPSQFSTLSPELSAAIEAKIKGQEGTLAVYLPGSADSRRRLDEITGKYSLSPEDQKRSDDLNRRTAESVERQANRR